MLLMLPVEEIDKWFITAKKSGCSLSASSSHLFRHHRTPTTLLPSLARRGARRGGGRPAGARMTLPPHPSFPSLTSVQRFSHVVPAPHNTLYFIMLILCDLCDLCGEHFILPSPPIHELIAESALHFQRPHPSFPSLTSVQLFSPSEIDHPFFCNPPPSRQTVHAIAPAPWVDQYHVASSLGQTRTC
jgi:hypothetical protein